MNSNVLKVGGIVAAAATTLVVWRNIDKFNMIVEDEFTSIEVSKEWIENGGCYPDNPEVAEIQLKVAKERLEECKENLNKIKQKHPILWKIRGVEKRYREI